MRLPLSALTILAFVCHAFILYGEEPGNYRELIFSTSRLKPIDSVLKVKVGDLAPDFTLPSIQGKKISLHQYKGKKNIVISFVPAAWTPVCSDQWPGYVFARPVFEEYDAVILGITVDNIPTLHAWTRQMGELWFPVLSDFWPHGGVADTYGVLRNDGTAERALFIVDKKGIIRALHVEDINERPPLDFIVKSLKQLNNR